MEFLFYPGCTMSTTAKYLNQCARASATALGVILEEVENWQCCGAVFPLAADEVVTKLAAVRALAQARAKGKTLVTLCSACHHVMKQVNHQAKNDADFRAVARNYDVGYQSTVRDNDVDFINTVKNNDVNYKNTVKNNDTNLAYDGEAVVMHFMEVLQQYIGFDVLQKKVAYPLKGRKIGAYYGCLLLRPREVMQFDDAENPRIVEDFIRALGATAVTYPMRNECCGGYRALEDTDKCAAMVTRVVESAVSRGADTLVTACPLCLYQLVEYSGGRLDVCYFTELLAEALGVDEDD